MSTQKFCDFCGQPMDERNLPEEATVIVHDKPFKLTFWADNLDAGDACDVCMELAIAAFRQP